MLRDPVCGMDVNPEQAKYSQEYDGQTYYFCSAHCLNRFRFDPGQYTGASVTGPASAIPGPPSERIEPQAEVSMPRDPVCGMEVNPEKARYSHEHDGRTYDFCCSGCLNAFKAGPARFLGARPAEAPSPAAGRLRCHTPHLPDVPRGAQRRTGGLPIVWHGARARALCGPGDQGRVHLPDAPGCRPGRRRSLSALRHGARVAHRPARGCAQPRASRHVTPVLDRGRRSGCRSSRSR